MRQEGKGQLNYSASVLDADRRETVGARSKHSFRFDSARVVIRVYEKQTMICFLISRRAIHCRR